MLVAMIVGRAGGEHRADASPPPGAKAAARRWPPSDTARAVRPLTSALILAATSLTATACGESTIKPDGAQKSVVDVVFKKTGFRPTDVKCPDGVEAKAGKTFTCHFTGPEGKSYIADMRVLNVDGERVNFFVSTRPG
jgi:hypothetical protein